MRGRRRRARSPATRRTPQACRGYAGTDLPERNIGANALEDEARARLADPDDPGGDAGRTVIEGKRGLTGPEFVRFATLAAMEDRPGLPQLRRTGWPH